MECGIKSRVFLSMVMLTVSFSFSACGSGSSGSTPPPNNANEWTWINGSNVANQPGTYGTIGTAAASNVPGAREQAVSWIDKDGNLWLFGGLDLVPTGSSQTNDLVNDLWKYSAGEWTWMSGSDVFNQPGIYGTLGIAASSNIPGARRGAVGWTDASGNLWLFGGNGLGSSAGGDLDDLWKYEP